MNKIPQNLLLFVLFLTTQMAAQSEFIIENDFLLFENAKNGEPVLVYNDSTLATGFHFTKKIKTSFPKELDKLFFNSNQYNVKGNTYLVDGGNGPVVQYENGKFKRIDKSFRHQNQFGGIPFQKENELYLWGGYGIFTYKKFLSKYDFKTQEWVEAEQGNKETIPPAQSSEIHGQIGNKVYLFGGYNKGFTSVNEKIFLDNSVWEFDTSQDTWRKSGYHNMSQFLELNKLSEGFVFTRKNKLILIKEDLFEIDILKDEVVMYRQNNFKNLKEVVYHPKTDQISYVYHKSNNTLAAITEPYNYFKGSLVQKGAFYTGSKMSSLSWLLLLMPIGIMFTWAFQKKRKTAIYKNKLLYKSAANIFIYNGRELKELTAPKKEILKVLMANPKEFLPLVELNKAITIDPKNESYGAIKKRREILIKELQKELSLVLSLDSEIIFETRKNQSDRRIKEIRLNVNVMVL